MQPPHSLQPVDHPPLAQHLALLIEQADVVMSLRPVDSQEDHLHLLHYRPVHQAEGDLRHPNRPVLEARHPTSRLDLLAGRGVHSLPLGLQAPWENLECSPPGGSDDLPIIRGRPVIFGNSSLTPWGPGLLRWWRRRWVRRRRLRRNRPRRRGRLGGGPPW